MRKLITSLLLAALLALSLVSLGAASDTTTSWNAHAASFHFDGYPQAVSASFGSIYHGSDFAADFAGIKQALSDDLQCAMPPWNGDDLLDSSLDNWP